MIGGILKKVLFKKNKEKDSPKENLAVSLREKSKELSKALVNQVDAMKTEFFVMKDKYDNLLETNYNLGLKHIENGNLSDAIFRFRFIKKFWPQHYDAFYQLAYCLVLNKKAEEAKEVLEELMIKNPQHQLGRELLELIDSDMNANQDLTA